ncbi:MAG: protein phosphatase 2C domain-containing protein [Nannocystaceae bacterium]
MTLIVSASARTITGRRRRNEDAYVLDPTLGLFVVLDGMGGYQGGEVASRVGANSIAEFYAHVADDPEATWPYALDPRRSHAENQVDAAIRLANRRIRGRRQGELRDMGATVALLSLSNGGAVIGHLGDSRIYRLRRGGGAPSLELLTCDHSLYEALRASGADLPPLAEFPHHNVITRALGVHEDEHPDTQRLELGADDRFLLCTDGLSGALDDAVIAAALAELTIEEVAERLVEMAYDAGSRDNITVVVVDVRRGRGRAAAAGA